MTITAGDRRYAILGFRLSARGSGRPGVCGVRRSHVISPAFNGKKTAERGKNDVESDFNENLPRVSPLFF